MIALKNTANNQIFYIIHKKMDGETGWDLSPLKVEYKENGQYSIVPPAGIDGYSSVNVTVDVDCKECNLTTSTVTIAGDGEHTITPPKGYDGFSEVVVNVESGCDDAYDNGVADQKAKLESATFTENGLYNREDGWNTVQVNVDTVTPYNNGERDGIAEQKAKLTSLNVTQNGTYRREDGYNEVIVAVPQLSDCEECRQAGIQEQKSKLTELQVTQNGEYEREDGYDRVVVDVDLNVPYNEGREDGAEEQKSKMISGTFTENGTYDRENGYNQVIVNVDTQTPYNNGYNDGKEDGIEEQKAKLGTITITENGTYTSENGYKDVIVDVQCKMPDTLEVSRELIEMILDGEFPADGVVYPIGVYSTDDWTITSKPDWVSTDSNSGNAGASVLMVTVTSFEDGRTGTITISNGKLTKTITITQTNYSARYLTLEVTSPGTLYWKLDADPYDYPVGRRIQFSTGGVNWFDRVSIANNNGCKVASLTTGTKLYIKTSTEAQNCLSHFVFADGLKGNISGNLGSFNEPMRIFKDCTGIQSAENLIVPEGTDCTGLFIGCTGLTTAPKSLPRGRYTSMFSGCTKLTTAPKLPSTTLSASCYSGMFANCSSLTTAPALPATVLTESCYQAMFRNCSNLINVPELPATTLAKRCYYMMFDGCSELVTAPELPATTLAEGCYMNMFYGCTSLATAPELPALELVDSCYGSMFLECNNINYIKAMFITTPEAKYTNRWLENTSTTGTFVKNAAATWDVTGYNGIPSGWTVETASV